jgi:hypothetical protein
MGWITIVDCERHRQGFDWIAISRSRASYSLTVRPAVPLNQAAVQNGLSIAALTLWIFESCPRSFLNPATKFFIFLL